MVDEFEFLTMIWTRFVPFEWQCSREFAQRHDTHGIRSAYLSHISRHPSESTDGEHSHWNWLDGKSELPRFGYVNCQFVHANVVCKQLKFGIVFVSNHDACVCRWKLSHWKLSQGTGRTEPNTTPLFEWQCIEREFDQSGMPEPKHKCSSTSVGVPFRLSETKCGMQLLHRLL